MITEAHRQQLRDMKVETLAKTFADVLLEWLEKEQFEQMQRDNTERGEPRLCASHDYCDANMAMEEAVVRCTSPTFNVCDFMEEYSDVAHAHGVAAANAHESKAIYDKWNAAWALAYKLYLTVQEVARG